MVRITRVHTGGGDGGETSLLTGERVPKSNPRVEMYGTIDELNSLIGWVRMELSRLPKQHSDGGVRVPALRIEEELDPMLSIIQQELFDIGGESAGTPSALPEQMSLVEMKHADRLVQEMDHWTDQQEPLSSFILPSGSPVVVALHVVRTVTRRSERCAVNLLEAEGEGAVRPVVLAYLNRLSDWMFVAARHVNQALAEEEVLWVPLGTRDSES